MKKRILALLLAVCVACSMLILPASASGSNTAVQTAVTLGGLTSDQTANLAAPLTRGALTTFSFANDVAKYFAIIPAMFAGLFVADGMASGPLSALNIMGLNSPQSAILSTVIFNALIIVALIPLALKGVSYRPAGAASLLKRNILIYGVGGLIAPFMGIKLIDMVINAWRLV